MTPCERPMRCARISPTPTPVLNAAPSARRTSTSRPSCLKAAVPAHPAPVDDCLFYQSNVGMAAGFTLVDGRRIVAKVHDPAQTRSRLAAVQRVQGRLADAGYPCPRPLGMGHCAHAFVTMEELRDDGEYRDGTTRGSRDHGGGARRTGEHRRRRTRRPRPHPRTGPRPAFTLARHAPSPVRLRQHPRAGAEWIDDWPRGRWRSCATTWARSSSGTSTGGSSRCASTPTGSCRVRLGQSRARLRDDDRRVRLAGLPARLGRGETRLWPTLDEQVAFVDAYESVRGRPFSGDERRSIAAAGAFQSAYGARCEHAVADPGEDVPEHSQRAGLTAQGDALFTLLN